MTRSLQCTAYMLTPYVFVCVFIEFHLIAQSGSVFPLSATRTGPPVRGLMIPFTNTIDQTRQRGQNMCACLYVAIKLHMTVQSDSGILFIVIVSHSY